MIYQFNSNLSLEDSVKEIAFGIIEEAKSECHSNELPQDKIIHSLRKKCKRMRGLLRIVRPNIENIYKSENQFYRDISRKLSVVRDIHAAIETVKQLEEHYGNKFSNDLVANLINQLNFILNDADSSKLIDEFNATISGVAEGINSWDIKVDGFDAIEGGLKKTYNRGKRAMAIALADPTSQNFHEWRKRVKYHYFHLELIVPIWEPIISQYSKEADNLSEMLGYDHDLSMFLILLNDENKLLIEKSDKKQIFEIISIEQSLMRENIKYLGQKIYAEKPSQMVKRIESYWQQWESENKTQFS